MRNSDDYNTQVFDEHEEMNGEIRLIFIRQNAMILTITIVSKHAVHIGLEILWRCPLLPPLAIEINIIIPKTFTKCTMTK